MSGAGGGRLRVAVLGATGLVGREMLSILAERRFPAEVVALASARSAGRTVACGDRELTVSGARPESFDGIDVVLASAGAAVARELAPAAVARGAVVIDNSSAFRLDPDVPLVVPEVNPHRLAAHRGVIANPNCSTIQLVVALKPLHDAAGLTRVTVATYQAVSGAGRAAVEELLAQSRSALAGAAPAPAAALPRPIAFDLLPQIGDFGAGGETGEERKIRLETGKILEHDVPLHATCVRVPVVRGHSEAVWIETARPLSPEEARELWRSAPGVELLDEPAARAPAAAWPTPAVHAAGRDAVVIGRVRRDPRSPRGLAFWVVADNLRKGAALNAVQIAELLVPPLRGRDRGEAYYGPELAPISRPTNTRRP